MTTQVHAQAKAPPTVTATRISTPSSTGILQRKCACGGTPGPDGECAACRQKRLAIQRHAKNTEQATSATVPPIVHDVLRSPGQPLDTATRTFVESRFGHDFSRVRVHTDGQAAQSARAVNALAYTVGQNIVFGNGQFAPGTVQGKKLLAHELTHTMHQAAAVTPHTPDQLTLGDAHDEYEREADHVVQALALQERGKSVSARIQPLKRVQAKTIQRFSTKEHELIATQAYNQAFSEAQQPSSTRQAQPGVNNKELIANLSKFNERLPKDAKVSKYGELVAAADYFATFEQAEEEGKKGPLKFESNLPYFELAARNRTHFHPHNFINWQRWHWQALHIMYAAYLLDREADAQKAEAERLNQRFYEHERRARQALLELSALDQEEANRTRKEELEKIADEETAEMERILPQWKLLKQQSMTKKENAKNMALRAMAMNAFGDHFLTDAFAGGHIVTPRKELLDEYSTRFLFVLPVQPELSCASVPSLAWHDLDNKFGVSVTSNKAEWLAFGDDYAGIIDPSEEAKGSTYQPTHQYAILATKASIKQMLEAASGKLPGDLSAVLDYVPRPDLSIKQYPRWQPTPQVAWEAQLRYATGLYGKTVPLPSSLSSSEKSQSSQGRSGGGQVGQSQSPQTAPEDRPRVDVPNPHGQQFGLRQKVSIPILSDILSAGFTCLNVLPTFSYDRFVLPMIARLKNEYSTQFFTRSQGQIVSPDEKPEAQESASGRALLGTILGLIGGAAVGVGVGLLIGGPLGAIVGSLIAVTGAVIGGLIGNASRQPKQEK